LEGLKNTVSWLILKIVVLGVLLLLSGFFSGSETALIKIGRLKARSLLKRGVKGADTVQKLVNEPEVWLTTVLIGNNIVNIAASALATSIAIEYFGDFGVGIAIGVMTFLILTFGEIIRRASRRTNFYCCF
jgi:putative hemolysin